MRAVHVYFDEFVPGSKKDLVSGSRSLFENIVRHTIPDPARTGDDDSPKRSGSVRYQSQERGVDRVIKSSQPFLVGG